MQILNGIVMAYFPRLPSISSADNSAKEEDNEALLSIISYPVRRLWRSKQWGQDFLWSLDATYHKFYHPLEFAFCRKLHSAVYWIQHCNKVYAAVQQRNAGIATFLTVAFDFRKTSIQVHPGSLLIATKTLLMDSKLTREVINYNATKTQGLSQSQPQSLVGSSRKRNSPHGSPACFNTSAVTAIGVIRHQHYHDHSRQLLANPEKFITDLWLNFDEITTYLQYTCLIHPIVART